MRPSLALIGILLALGTPCVMAGDLNSKPYLLRFGAALRRATGYPAAAALQATAAHPEGWSINPASHDVLNFGSEEATSGAKLANQNAWTQSGAWFTDSSVAARFSLPSQGTVSLAYARTDTVKGDTYEGFENVLRSNEFFWGYSKSLTEQLAVGGMIRFLTAYFQEETSTSELPVPARFETDVESLDVNLGARFQLNPVWSVGVIGGVGWGWASVDVANLAAFANPVPPPEFIPAETRLFGFDDRHRTKAVRAGLGFTPTPFLGFYADGEFFQLTTAAGPELDTSRFLCGVEIAPCPHRTVRVGTSVDRFGNTTISAGLGIAPVEHVVLEVAYQYDAFPEMASEFGKFHLLHLAVAMQY